MGKTALQDLLQHLRTVAAVQTHRELSDRQLLEHFVASRDEAAFTVLIDWHGPMVLGAATRGVFATNARSPSRWRKTRPPS
jgi:hypothetical protein